MQGRWAWPVSYTHLDVYKRQLHIWSTLPEGEILLIPNSVFAGGVGYDLTVKGEGGHGGRPDLVKDPIKAACEMVLKFASIPSNFYDVLDHSVVNVGRIEAGTIGNVFPSEAKLYGGFRWYKPEMCIRDSCFCCSACLCCTSATGTASGILESI